MRQNEIHFKNTAVVAKKSDTNIFADGISMDETTSTASSASTLWKEKVSVTKRRWHLPKKALAIAIVVGMITTVWKSLPLLKKILPAATALSAEWISQVRSFPSANPSESLSQEPTVETLTSGVTEASASEEGELLTAEQAAAQKLLPVKEVLFANNGNIKSADGSVQMSSRSKSYTIDIDAELKKEPDVHLKNTAEPQVLIYHTHTSECFSASYNGYYSADADTRSLDGSKGVLRVGDIITQKLREAGITAIHDTTVNDSPAYNGAYGRSLVNAESYLKEYPSIQVILDVHRDSITQNDGTKLKPTVVINGKKAAQIMIVSGCDDNGTLGYPDWRYNLVFGLQLQKALAQNAPNLARPLYFWSIRYNQHLTHGTLLLEFGTEVNTYDEVAYSAELFSASLIQVLNTYKKG